MHLIDIKAVAGKLSVHQKTIYVFLRTDDTFPRPMKITPSRNRWLESDIDNWIRLKQGENNDD